MVMDSYIDIFDTLKSLLAVNHAPVMLVGVHGVGKSSVIEQIGKDLNCEVINVRLSQMSEGDILGIPYKTDDGTTRFYPPDIFKKASDQPCILFLDELNRASREVRQAVFQLADSRRLGSLVLHPYSIVVAACNPDDGVYQVHTLDPAEMDRWFMFPFAPSVYDWIYWAEDNQVEPVVIEYIRQRPFDLDPDVNSPKNGPSRRSWTRLSRTLSLYPQASGERPDVNLVRFLATGFLGKEVADNFTAFYIDFQKKTVLQKVLAGETPDLEPVELSVSLVNNITYFGKLETNEATPDMVVNFCTVVNTLPKEARDAVLKSVKKHCSEDFHRNVVEARKMMAA